MQEDEDFCYEEHEQRVAQEVNEFIEMFDHQFIDLEGRRLKGIQFLESCKLETSNIISLNVKSNMLLDLMPLSMFDNLQILYIADNNLTSLDQFPQMEFLTHLDISKNKLTNIDAIIPSIKHLETLKMNNNFIKSLQPLTNAYKLKELDATYNDIQIHQLYHIGHLSLQKVFFCIVSENQTIDVNGNFSAIENREYPQIREQILSYLPKTVQMLDVQISENEYFFARRLTWKGFVSQIDMDPIQVTPDEIKITNICYDLLHTNINYILDTIALLKDLNEILSPEKQAKLQVKINI